jgi:hypothetical protein
MSSSSIPGTTNIITGLTIISTGPPTTRIVTHLTTLSTSAPGNAQSTSILSTVLPSQVYYASFLWYQTIYYYARGRSKTAIQSTDVLTQQSLLAVTAIDVQDASTQLLSTGAQAGIGVGAGIGGLALIALIVWFVFRQRRNRTQRDAELHGESKPELEATSKALYEKDASKGAGEAEGKTIHEAPSKLEELEGQETRRYELEGEWRGTEVG